MKNKKLIILIGLMVVLSVLLVGCSTNNAKSPTDIITDAYGNQQFKITFNSDGLSKPMDDMFYSAKKIPKLPVPERVGYIFSGWYFDKEYTVPYTDNSLYLHMKNVTLYPKWEREKFVQDGIYDIEISAVISNITKKGPLADNYPIQDFTKAIIKEETYIEKTKEGLQLKLQYKADTVPFGESPVYSVYPSRKMGDDIRIVETIAPDNDTVKTLFFNIDKLDITKPIYLDLATVTYDHNLPKEDYSKTAVSYEVTLTIDRLIGFSRPFINPNNKLDKNTYYLVKTHYDTMAEAYNPVYSYVEVDSNGNYKLIKPFMPYTGVIDMVSKEGAKPNLLDNFYHRGMSFSPVQLYYRSNPDREYNKTEMEHADYLPQLVNGENYGDFSVEFNGETGKYYMIYDLGTDIKKEFIISGATTGFMEMTEGMGKYDIRMYIDYDHIIQLASIDYTPLDGECEVFKENIKYYPGKYNDLNDQNKTKELVDENGISTNLFNYFYSATSKKAPISERKIHSHKITVKASNQTKQTQTKDARYQVADFNVETSVYGYNPLTDGNLYGDSMTVCTFGGKSFREIIEVKNGKMIEAGSKVWLEELFKEKVTSNVNTKEVKATIYNIVDGVIDVNSAKTYNNIQMSITFTSPIAIRYEYKSINDNCYALVNLAVKSSPKFEDNHVTDGHITNHSVPFTEINYIYGTNSGHFMGLNYMFMEKDGMNPTKAVLFIKKGNTYKMEYLDFKSESFLMKDKQIVIGYEMSNQFREKQMVYLQYNAVEGPKYQIKRDDEIVTQDEIKYNEDNVRIPVRFNDRFATEFSNYSDLVDIFNHNYTFNINGEARPMSIATCNIYSNNGCLSVDSDYANQLKGIITETGYGIVEMIYISGEDSYRKLYTYNLKVSGKNTFSVITDECLFTNYNYIINLPNIVLPDGTNLKAGELQVIDPTYSGKHQVENNNGQFSIKFGKPGNYSIVLSASIGYNEYGDKIFDGNEVFIQLKQNVVVKDINKKITITYITDNAHPFADNVPYTIEERDGKEVYCHKTQHLLSDIFLTLREYQNFKETDDYLYAWSPKPWSKYNLVDAERMYGVGKTISNVIEEFGSDNIEFYSIWDSGINYLVDMSTEITGQDNYTERAILNNDMYKGWYAVPIPKSNLVMQPEGWIFTGWTVVETGDFYPKGRGLPILTREAITLKATFVRDYIVRFDVDYKYGYGIPSINVQQNSKIEPPTATAKDGYTFVGFRLATKVNSYGQPTEIASANFDFNNPADTNLVSFKTITNEVIIFVAVFSNANGDLVWN